MSVLKELSNDDFLALIQKGKPDAAARAELASRTDGLLPVENINGTVVVNKNAFDELVEYCKLIHSVGRKYSKTEFKGFNLIPIKEYTAPKPSTIACEPYTKHVLAADGTDPETTIVFPVKDADAMSKHAWLATYLPAKAATFRVTDDDQVADLVDQVNGKKDLKLNVRNLLAKWAKATPEERKEAEKLLTVVGMAVDAAIESEEVVVKSEHPAPSYEVKNHLNGPTRPNTNNGVKTIVVAADPNDYHFVDLLKLHFGGLANSVKIFCLSKDVVPGANASKEHQLWLGNADALLYFTNAGAYNKYPLSETIEMAKYAKVIPVLIRSSIMPPELSRLKPIPSNYIASSSDKDSAMVDVVRAIRSILGI